MEINTDITITKKAVNFKFCQVSIIKHEDASKAIVVFQVGYSDNSTDTLNLPFEGEKFNEFWDNFNDMKYIYLEIGKALGAELELSGTMDETIYNKVIAEEPKQDTE